MLLWDHCGETVILSNSIHCAYIILSVGFILFFAVSFFVVNKVNDLSNCGL